MIKSTIIDTRGLTLIEVMLVIAIISVLASIAVPNMAVYSERARKVSCLVNRKNIENDAIARLAQNQSPASDISSEYKCLSGGVYVWLITDSEDQGYPKVGCSIHYAPLPSLSAEDALFSSDFDTMDGLTPLVGSWENRDGALVPTDRGENRLSYGDTNWKDYEINVNANISEGKGYGIYFRADGDNNISGYCFQYDPGYGKGAFLVRKVVNGKEKSPIVRTWIPDNFTVYNQSHETTITSEGDHHVIKVDGQEIFDFHDSTFSSGSAGFRSWGNSTVKFQDVIVSNLQ